MGFEKLTEYIDSLEKEYGIHNADCLIKKDGKVVYRHMMGHSDYELTVPTSDQDFYILFSATKVITMTAVMQLIEQKKLGLYDLVSKYLPEFEVMKVINREFQFGVFPMQMPTKNEPSHYAQNQIRIMDLMSMMAGLTYDIASEAIKEVVEKTGGKANTREIIKAIAEMPLIYEPGTRYAYSLAHDVLAGVIEVVSGQKFSEYLNEHIFAPLGIKDMYFTLPEGKEVAALYGFDFKTQVIGPVPRHNMYKITENYESGGAGLMGTVDAYSKVIDALANGGVGETGARILEEDTIKLFMNSVTSGVAQEDFEKSGKGPYDYGLGVRVKNSMESGKTPIGEFGWDGAAGAYVLVDPINHISIFYAQHVMMFITAYSVIHPTIRDLAYEAMDL